MKSSAFSRQQGIFLFLAKSDFGEQRSLFRRVDTSEVHVELLGSILSVETDDLAVSTVSLSLSKDIFHVSRAEPDVK